MWLKKTRSTTQPRTRSQIAAAITLAALSTVATLTLPTSSEAQPSSQAQAWPTRPARVVVGFSPGGPTDLTARLIAKHLSDDLGQPFVVENKAGAGGDIATRDVAQAAPNGYTALVAGINLTINPWMNASNTVDSRRDLTPVRRVAIAPTVLVVRNDFPASTFAEFLQEVRNKSGKYNTAAPGASPLLAAGLFARQTGARITPVPYKGAAPAMTDLMAGHVDMSFATLGSILPLIQSGKVRALALASPARDARLPDVPTFTEQGMPDFKFDSWVGLLLPAGAPQSVVQTLAASLDRLAQSPSFAQQVRDIGLAPVPHSTPQSFARIIDAELDLYETLAQSVRTDTAHAQAVPWPNQTVRLVVGFAPGGPTDVQARLLASRLGGLLGQTVVVENKPGASTTIAMAEVARAVPDGHTLYFGGSGAYATTPLVIPDLPYAPRNFLPVAMVGEEQIAVAVHPSVSARNMADLLAQVQAHPGKFSYGSSGHGNITHLTGELIKHAAGNPDLVHVAYKGAAPAVNDTLAGHIDVVISGLGSVYPLHQDGRLRVLAITSEKRVPYAPDIPVMAESGITGVRASTTLVLLAPAGTPAAIVSLLARAVGQAVAQPAYQADMRASYVEPITDSTPEKTGQLLQQELAQWKTLVQQSGIRIQ